MGCEPCKNYRCQYEHMKLIEKVKKLEKDIQKASCDSNCEDCDILKNCQKYMDLVNYTSRIIDRNSHLRCTLDEEKRLNTLYRNRASDMMDELTSVKRKNMALRCTCVSITCAVLLMTIIRIFGG